jgi:hypothetical protein
MRIEGALTGKALDINGRNMARVISVNLDPQVHNAFFDARTWTAGTTVTPTGAADEFFYMLNTHTRLSLVISRLTLAAASSETITLAGVTGTAAGGTTLTPVNRTLTSGNTPTATIQSGVDITGLTPGTTLETFTGTTATYIDLTRRPIILLPNAAVALSATTGAIAVTFALDFYVQLVEPAEF